MTSAGIATLGVLSASGAQYSEDCLYLNVWTKPQVGEAKKAVLVWIYGGGFSSGSSTIPAYNGANLVEEQDVIVVSLKYVIIAFYSVCQWKHECLANSTAVTALVSLDSQETRTVLRILVFLISALQ